MPTSPSSSSTALLKMLELAGGLSKSHEPVPSNTMMSPRWIGRRW